MDRKVTKLLFVCIFCALTNGAEENDFIDEVIREPIEALINLKIQNRNLVEIDKQRAKEVIGDITSALNLAKHAESLSKSMEQHSVKPLRNGMLKAEPLDDRANCSYDMTRMMLALANNELWALKMIDANGKPETGILEGAVNWIGAFDECKRIEPVTYNEDRSQTFTPFHTQYCKVPINPVPALDLFGQNFKVSTGYCLPDSCSETEARDVLNEMLKLQQPIANRTFRAGRPTCVREPEFDDVAIIAIVVLGFLTFLSLVGTAVDIFYVMFPSTRVADTKKRDGTEVTSEKTPLVVEKDTQKEPQPGIFRRLCLSFSIYSNGKKLLNTSQGAESLTALNGVRFLSISWVVLGHTYSNFYRQTKNALVLPEEMISRWTFQAIANALVSVDSFFALSGLLLAYLTLKELENKGGPRRFNWLMFYFHRFWRLTPVYMLILLADVGLFRYVSDGPEWRVDGLERDQCKESWWWNLLYINNFEIKEGVSKCFGHAWYLANDMQFFVISPLMMVPLHYNGFIGMGVCMAFILGTWIATGLISTDKDLPPTSLSIRGPSGDYFKDYYIKPWCRIGPYVVGIMFGYLLYKFRGRFRLNKFINLFIWAVMAALALVVLYGLHDYFNGTDLDTEVVSLFNATHRTVWGLCVCWVIFACATGHGGYVNTLLSWSAFTPLARLSYCVYLVHPMVLAAYYYSLRQHLFFNDHVAIYLFLAHLVMSNMAAFVASVLFEAPMLGLEKIIFRRGKK